MINASPTSMGLLTNRGPPDWHPASDDLKVFIIMIKEYWAKILSFREFALRLELFAQPGE